MKAHHATIALSSAARVTFHDITDDVKEHVARSAVRAGIAVVASPHTTCSVVIQEESHDRTCWGDEYLMRDLCGLLEAVAPDSKAEGRPYLHPGPKHIASARAERGEEPWWSLNVDAHLRSVWLGRSETVAIVDGEVVLGEFGRFYFIDFDQVRARDRTVSVSVLGC